MLDRALPAFTRGFDRSFARHLSRLETKALQGALQKVLVGNGRRAPECPPAYLEDRAASA